MRVQIKGPDLLFSADTLGFPKIKNCDLDNFRICTKISHTLRLVSKFFTTLPKYTDNKNRAQKGR